MLVSTVTLFAMMALSTQERSEIRVEHVSAGYIIDLIMRTEQVEQDDPPKGLVRGTGLVPEGVTIELTPGRNSITAKGSSERLREMARIIELFDKAPRQAALEIHAYAPALNRTVKTTTTIYNNNAWEYFDQSSETRIEITPRINGDDTITMVITCGTLGSYATGVARIKPGQLIYIHVLPLMVKNTETSNMEGRLELFFTFIDRQLTGFFTDERPLLPGIDLSKKQTYMLFKADQLSHVSPPKEAEFRIEITARLPAISESERTAGS